MYSGGWSLSGTSQILFTAEGHTDSSGRDIKMKEIKAFIFEGIFSVGAKCGVRRTWRKERGKVSTSQSSCGPFPGLPHWIALPKPSTFSTCWFVASEGWLWRRDDLSFKLHEEPFRNCFQKSLSCHGLPNLEKRKVFLTSGSKPRFNTKSIRWKDSSRFITQRRGLSLESHDYLCLPPCQPPQLQGPPHTVTKSIFLKTWLLINPLVFSAVWGDSWKSLR